MQTLSQLSAKLQVQGDTAQMPADRGTAKVEEFCKALLEVGLSNLDLHKKTGSAFLWKLEQTHDEHRIASTDLNVICNRLQNLVPQSAIFLASD